ncbi:MAG: hypothetical protein HYU64_06915 [Armatimonadetes bacterium]|nr:hypothetical protein [Armatimonadota bacterium]
MDFGLDMKKYLEENHTRIRDGVMNAARDAHKGPGDPVGKSIAAACILSAEITADMIRLNNEKLLTDIKALVQ